MTQHLIGLLLGTEEDWPAMFEEVFRRLAPSVSAGGTTHTFAVERITIEPFDLRSTPRYDLVVDRLAHWYYVPREWLKKVALMDRVYLLNNPFTFQSMEKHSAYCMLMRLGLKVPTTWMVPTKDPVDNERFVYTSRKYNRMFDLEQVAEQVGYPLFMKPFDGGAWVGVSRIADAAELHQAYDESGQRLMHLQASVEGFDAFARSLTIGPETMVMRFEPDRPMHQRYQIDHDFLDPQAGEEVLIISRLVNALFRWEFNSCESLVLDGQVHPIDYANACPDVSLTSLHYYFPWAISRLVKWSVFCAATNRTMQVALNLDPWFAIADDPDRTYADKLAGYRDLSEAYFDTDAYLEFCDTELASLDAVLHELVTSPWFDALLVQTVRTTFPAHEHESMVDRYRGLLGAWAQDAAR
ncbi:MAG: ATP-grasp domain-containing protein [Euzebya sp.]